MSEIRAIPTFFRGIEFRSRLEARWAALFTNIGWKWTYEPFDGNGYIPDFLIHGDNPLLVEVKPAVTNDDYHEPWEKINKGLSTSWQGGVFLAGADPLPGSLWDSPFFPNIAGIICPRAQYGTCDSCHKKWREEHEDSNETSWDALDGQTCEHWRWWWSPSFTDSAYWVMEPENGMVRLRCESSYDTEINQCRFPFPYEGRGTQAASRIEQAWADACNEVKWRA